MTYAIYLDINRCSGCQACMVACMDQNDLMIENKEETWRQVFTVEDGRFPEAKTSYLSFSCLHCQDAPCIPACLTGAISRENSLVVLNSALCVGCHMCLIACPFGIPRFDKNEKMQKCTMCKERIEEGLEPACVRVCPTEALKFEVIDELEVEKEGREPENWSPLANYLKLDN
ncbi:MAG: 4Fe-4S dicluster domain-containing protein [Proteobacteria bacterium]|nr:4Fe-4S dicluster domain-containing protein [Pseudomonadota bacterium]